MEDYLAERVNRARTLLVAQQLDAVIATSSSNFYYFTGVHIEPHERLLAFILPRQGDPVILAPKLNEEEFAGISIEARFWSDGQDTTELLGTVLPKEGNISVDSSWPSKSLLSLMAHRPNLRFVDSATTLSHLRLRKDARELCLLREAGVLTDRVMANVIGDIRVGMTELDVVERLKHFWRQERVYELAFAPIVGVGANGAMPHHQPDATRIQPMDTVVIDMGGIWKHYLSDMTRTIVVGEVAQPVREAYSIVKQAQLAGMAAVKPGVPIGAIDVAARTIISDAGYGRYFNNRTGHGVGMEIHEEPYAYGENATVLEEGMVFSVEPGIYIPGGFGIRIEDVVIVTEDGCESMYQFTKELLTV